MAVYRRNWWPHLAAISVALAFLFYALLPDLNARDYRVRLFALAYVVLFIGFRILRRRAIIFTPDALISRPVLGHAERVPFASIMRFSVLPPVSLPLILEFFLFPVVPTLEKLHIKLHDGKLIEIPLDVGRNQEIILSLKDRVHDEVPRADASPRSG